MENKSGSMNEKMVSQEYDTERTINKKDNKAKNEVLAVYKPAGIVCTEDKREKKNIIRFLNYPLRVTYPGNSGKKRHRSI